MTSPLVLSLLSAALLFLPGLAVGVAVGLRGWMLAGVAPALTLGVTAAVSIALPAFGVGFGLTSYVLALVVVLAVLVAVARPWRQSQRRESDEPRWSARQDAAVAGAVTFTALLGGRVFEAGTRALVGYNQTWDGIFHGAIVRYIADTGHASPSALGPLLAPHASNYFYPDVFHALAALEVRITGGGVQAVLNALTVPLPLVFALASVAWVRQITDRSAVAFAVAGLAGMFTSLPYDVISFGTLYPFALAGVAMPAVAALTSATLDRPLPRHWLALGIGAAGVFATHPSVGFSVAILCVVLLAGRLVAADARRAVTGRVWLALAGALVVAALILSANIRAVAAQAGAVGGVDWPAVGTPSAELGNLIFFGATTPSPQVWLALVFLVGVITLPRYPRMWPVAAYAAITAGLFVEAAGYDGQLSLTLTQFWWNDRFRLAAMFIVPALLIAAIGAVRVVDLAVGFAVPRITGRTWVARLDESIRAVLRPGLAALAVILFVLLTNVGYHAVNARIVGEAFDEKYLVRPGSTQAFDQLRKLNGTSRPVVNNPLDGTGWAYAEADVPVLFKAAFLPNQVTEQDLGSDEWTILQSFDRLDTDPAVQQAVRNLNARYVIVGPARLFSPKGQFPGFNNLKQVHSLVKVWANGADTIYRIDLPGPDES